MPLKHVETWAVGSMVKVWVSLKDHVFSCVREQSRALSLGTLWVLVTIFQRLPDEINSCVHRIWDQLFSINEDVSSLFSLPPHNA